MSAVARVDGRPGRSDREGADRLKALRGEVCGRETLLRADGGVVEVYPTGTNARAADELARFARGIDAGRVLEVGLGVGISALALGEAVLLSEDPGAVLLSVDPATGNYGDAGRLLVEGSPLGPRWRLDARRSEIALPELTAAGRRFDLAYIDGAHWFESALLDIYFAGQLVGPGGWLLVDDTPYPAVALAVEYAKTNLGLEPGPPMGGGLAALRAPEPSFPVKRAWDHFEPFGGVVERGERAGADA